MQCRLAPRGRAWIETPHAREDVGHLRRLAPRGRAWIETSVKPSASIKPRVAWPLGAGRGLKQARRYSVLVRDRRLAPRGRAPEQGPKALLLLPMARPPSGAVRQS